VATAQDYPYTISPVCHSSHPQRADAKFRQAQFATAHNVPGAKSGYIKHLFYQEKTPSLVNTAYLMTRLATPNHVILACSRLYTLISKFPDKIPPADNWSNGPYYGCSATPGIA